MPFRDVIIFGMVFAVLAATLTRPWIGAIAWAWLGYMNPHRLTWGPAYDFPFSQLIALCTLVSIAIMAMVQGKLPKLPMKREVVLILLLWTTFGLTTMFALTGDEARTEFVDISKILFMTLVTIALIDDRFKFNVLVWTVALSIGFYGFKGGIFSILTGGQFLIYGPQGSFMDDNTSIGLALNMTLPFIFFLAKNATRPMIKRAMYATFVLCVLSVMFTYSRGAFLGLVVVLGLLFLRLPMIAKVAAVVLVISAAPLVLGLVPQAFVDRVETIRNYEDDGSANGRLMAWTTGWKVGTARPLTGGGFGIVDDLILSQRFNPNATEAGIGVHSVYFELIAENGFIAFGIYMLMVVLTLRKLSNMRRFARGFPDDSLPNYCEMIRISLCAFLVTGAFLEMASFDLFYLLIALTVILDRVKDEFAEAKESAPETADQPLDHLGLSQTSKA